MALGGGNFITQNKVLPGSYINFVSTNLGVNVFGERGVGAMAIQSDWLAPGIQTVTQEDFQKNCLKIFGCEYTTSNILLNMLENFFKNGKTLLLYNLNSGGTKASNIYATAKNAGSGGNNIKIVIATNVDDEEKYDVSTYMGGTLVDTQTVATAAELVGNDFVDLKTTATLQVTTGTNLTGGTNSVATNASYTKFLELLESYTFNAVTFKSTNAEANDLLVAWTKRMRDEVGKKFVAVVPSDFISTPPNYEGIVVVNEPDLMRVEYILAWTCGALAGCEVNGSLTNKLYDGTIAMDNGLSLSIEKKTQAQLEECLKNGEFVFHYVGDEIRVLKDINSLTEFTEEKGKVFSSNQTIRVCDQIAMDIAEIFNNYFLGKVPNDVQGRTSLWNEIVKHHQELETLRAIESFDKEALTVEQGEEKGAVVVTDCITVTNAMEKLYMTVYVE